MKHYNGKKIIETYDLSLASAIENAKKGDAVKMYRNRKLISTRKLYKLIKEN